jgi:hypothetical protein
MGDVVCAVNANSGEHDSSTVATRLMNATGVVNRVHPGFIDLNGVVIDYRELAAVDFDSLPTVSERATVYATVYIEQSVRLIAVDVALIVIVTSIGKRPGVFTIERICVVRLISRVNLPIVVAIESVELGVNPVDPVDYR